MYETERGINIGKDIPKRDITENYTPFRDTHYSIMPK